jgi:hypothetical protein
VRPVADAASEVLALVPLPADPTIRILSGQPPPADALPGDPRRPDVVGPTESALPTQAELTDQRAALRQELRTAFDIMPDDRPKPSSARLAGDVLDFARNLRQKRRSSVTNEAWPCSLDLLRSAWECRKSESTPPARNPGELGIRVQSPISERQCGEANSGCQFPIVPRHRLRRSPLHAASIFFVQQRAEPCRSFWCFTCRMCTSGAKTR